MSFPFRSEHYPDVASTKRGGLIVRDILPLAIVICALTFCPACSSWSKSPPDTWTASYFKNPDRVWAGILETLIDLGYDVAESNRQDGRIRTEPHVGEESPGVVLTIDQVMRTGDQVNVYIKPSLGDTKEDVDPNLLKGAGDRFLAALNKRLQG